MFGRHTTFRIRFLMALGGAVALALLWPAHAGAQAPQDPQALAWLNQGLALLNGGTALSDVTLQATVTYTAGSDIETGTGTLQALGDSYGLVVLNLTDGQRQYIRQPQAGAWIAVNGQVSQYALQNCWTDAAWFFPGLAFTFITSTPQVGISNLGQTTWNDLAVNEIEIYQLLPGQQPTAPPGNIQRFSTEEIYLDPTTELPLAIDFNTYPDDGSPGTIAIEIQFSNYQTEQGMSIPLHVQQFINGSVALDVAVTNVAVNSGLSTSLFSIP